MLHLERVSSVLAAPESSRLGASAQNSARISQATHATDLLHNRDNSDSEVSVTHTGFS